MESGEEIRAILSLRKQGSSVDVSIFTPLYSSGPLQCALLFLDRKEKTYRHEVLVAGCETKPGAGGMTGTEGV